MAGTRSKAGQLSAMENSNTLGHGLCDKTKTT